MIKEVSKLNRDELMHTAIYHGNEFSDELYHWKYIDKYKNKLGKWIYVYNRNKKPTVDKPNESKRSNAEIGFDMETTNKEFDQTKEKKEKAAAEYDNAVKKLHEAYSSNDGKLIGFMTKYRDRKLKDLKMAESEHEKVVKKVKKLMAEYENNNGFKTKWSM